MAVLAAAGGLIAKRYKYELKQFVKEHQVLYSVARKSIALKERFFRPDAVPLRDIDLDREDWFLTFDAAKTLGTYERFWGSLGFETFRTGLVSTRSMQLFSFIKEANARIGGGDFSRQPFRYVRAHNLFSNGEPPWGEGLDIVQVEERGAISYNWNLTDLVFDRILEYGMKPIVEFGFMPDALASIPDRRQRWGKGNISPPADYGKWRDLVHQTVKHFVDRYGREEVNSWYFEVWNEPDLGYLFWIEDSDPKKKPYGDMKAYYELYDNTVAAACSALPTIKVGGPASAGGAIEGLLEHVLITTATNGQASKIDFTSSHAYNYVGYDYRQPMNVSLVSKLRWKLERSVNHEHPDVRAHARKIPFLMTETGPKMEKKHGVDHKARYAAAWYAKLVDGMFWLGDSLGMSYRPSEIVLWSAHQVIEDFDLTDNGIAALVGDDGKGAVFKLPMYNVIEALGYLSNERIQQLSGSLFGDAVHAIATRNKDESVEFLIYHLDETTEGKDPKRSGMNDDVRVAIAVRNLPFSDFKLYRYAIDSRHSNAYSMYHQLGAPKKATPQQVREIAAVQDLTLVAPESRESVNDGRFRLEFRMQKNSVTLIRLLREY